MLCHWAVVSFTLTEGNVEVLGLCSSAACCMFPLYLHEFIKTWCQLGFGLLKFSHGDRNGWLSCSVGWIKNRGIAEFKERSDWMTVEWWTLKSGLAGLHWNDGLTMWNLDSGMVDLKERSNLSPSLAWNCAGYTEVWFGNSPDAGILQGPFVVTLKSCI